MKKFLTILWIVIIAGAILIAIKLFKPETSQQPIQDLSTIQNTIEDNSNNLNLDNTNFTQTDKTYAEYLKDGNNKMKSGENEKAILSFTNATLANPTSTEPLMKLGEAYLKNNEPANAEIAFKKAEEIDNDSFEIKIAIARSYLNQRNIEKAKNQIWQLETETPQTKYYKGVILILYKDFEGSQTEFEEIIVENEKKQTAEADESLPPTDPELIKNTQIFLDAYKTFSYFTEGEQIHLQTLLAKALTDTKEFEAAIPMLFDILNEKNNYRDAWIVLGYAYLNTNKIIDAIDALNQAKALDEEKPETLFFLGLAYFANDEIDKAIIYIEQANENGYEPKEQIDLKLGDLYLLKEQYKESAEKYEEVLSKNTSNIELFTRVVWLNIDKLDNPQKALNFAYTAIEKYPQEAMSYNLAGWSLTALDNFKEAKKYLAKAMEINPEFDAASLNLGWFYEKQGLTTLAKEYYKRAYSLGNGNSITALAAVRYNNILEEETAKAYYKVNISAP